MHCYTTEARIQEEELGFMLARYISSHSDIDVVDPITDGLSENQSKAVFNACTKNISLLRGYAGTGKSTVIKRIIASYLKAGMHGAVFCPTGKAGKRVMEILYDKKDIKKEESLLDINFNSVKVSTIHMGLGVREKNLFVHDDENTLNYDFIVLDEATMGGLAIYNALFKALNHRKTRVVLTGDENQLPSVDSGNVFYDLVRNQFLTKIHLTEIFRQGKRSGIVQNAARILKGERPIKIDPFTGEKFEDISFVNVENDSEASRKILHEATKAKPLLKGYDPLTDIQVISPGKRGSIGTEKLNDELRKELNGGKTKGFCGFTLDDKVINRKNDYKLSIVNGDVGIVKDISKYGMTVDFGENTGPSNDGLVEFNFDNMSAIKLAYCYTVHSSQGSQFKSGIVPIYSSHYMLLFRNLLYTAMTRFSEDLTIFYQNKAMNKCIRTDVISKRKSNLLRFIDSYIKQFSSRK